jgi:hypothetical protein
MPCLTIARLSVLGGMVAPCDIRSTFRTSGSSRRRRSSPRWPVGRRRPAGTRCWSGITLSSRRTSAGTSPIRGSCSPPRLWHPQDPAGHRGHAGGAAAAGQAGQGSGHPGPADRRPHDPRCWAGRAGGRRVRKLRGHDRHQGARRAPGRGPARTRSALVRRAGDLPVLRARGGTTRGTRHRCGPCHDPPLGAALPVKRRDSEAARRFVRRARTAAGVVPSEVITNRAPAYPRVVDELSAAVWHHTEHYANDCIEARHAQLKGGCARCAGSEL